MHAALLTKLVIFCLNETLNWGPRHFVFFNQIVSFFSTRKHSYKVICRFHAPCKQDTLAQCYINVINAGYFFTPLELRRSTVIYKNVFIQRRMSEIQFSVGLLFVDLYRCFKLLLSLNVPFTILIHYKPRIAVAILDLQWMKMT